MIKETIAEVLGKRQQQVPKLKRLYLGLSELEKQLDTLQQMALQQVPKDTAHITADISNRINTIQEELSHLTHCISNVTKRFSRGIVNIGVAGSARQGKSTLLQKISGLTNKEIPTSNDLPCTGAKSKIYYSEVRENAEMLFYSKQEFLKEIVYPYFDRLNLPKPYSLDEFEHALPEFVAPDDMTERNFKSAIYEELKRIHRAFPSFKELLSQQAAETVALSQIRDYVTQHDDGGNIRTKYLAVKTANIYTTFPNHDVTGLCLVDLPGLEAAQGHEKKLVASLEQEVDAVILLKKPSPEGDLWNSDDFKVIDLINDAVREIELSHWLFILLNELDSGANKKIIHRLMENPPKTYSSKPILMTANCLDASEVDEKVFSVVIKHVEHNLQGTDKEYLRALAQRMQTILDTLNTVLENAVHAFNPEADLEQEEYLGLFDEFYDDLSAGLEDLVTEVREELEADVSGKFTFAESFKQKVDEICDMAQQAVPIPSNAELARKCQAKGGWFEVLQPLLHELRAYLTRYLAEHLDTYLKEKVNEVLKGLLERIFPYPLQTLLAQNVDDHVDPRHTILALQKQVDKTKQPQLYNSFEYIINFSFSYHSLLHHRVRREMSRLEPYMITELTDGVQRGKECQISEQIANGLEQFYKETVYDVRKKLSEEMQTDPADAIFALVEEIRDRLVRAKGIRSEWRRFIFRMRGQVWANKFGVVAKDITLCTHWQSAINEVIKTAQQVHEDFSDLI